MNAVHDPHDAMTASFASVTSTPAPFEVNDPWGATIDRGLGSQDLSSLLTGVLLPSIYSTAFDIAQPVGGKITVSAMNRILSVSGLPPAEVDK
ncbi:hypothetical protein BGW38_007274, partial [Lunasporangiospora selenospora]